jgi:hypothetical protein
MSSMMWWEILEGVYHLVSCWLLLLLLLLLVVVVVVGVHRGDTLSLQLSQPSKVSSHVGQHVLDQHDVALEQPNCLHQESFTCMHGVAWRGVA